MKSRNVILVSVSVIAIAAGLYGWSEYDRKPQSAGDRDEVATVSAEDLHAAFLADEAAANARYVGAIEQVIRVNGVVRSVEDAVGGKVSVVLETADAMAGVICEFEQGAVPVAWKAGDRVSLKGICTGVNDLIPDVILVRCAAVE